MISFLPKLFYKNEDGKYILSSIITHIIDSHGQYWKKTLIFINKLLNKQGIRWKKKGQEPCLHHSPANNECHAEQGHTLERLSVSTKMKEGEYKLPLKQIQMKMNLVLAGAKRILPFWRWIPMG